jgi:hypothetical protein
MAAAWAYLAASSPDRAGRRRELTRLPEAAGDDTRQANVLAGREDTVAARVARECAEQGIPSKLEDPVIISRILILMNAGRNSGVKDGATRSTSHGSRLDRIQHRAS